MNSRNIWTGAALVVALALAVWFLRKPSAEDAAQKGAAGPSATAHAGAAPAPTPGAVAPASAKAGAPAGNGNGNGNGNEAGAKPRKDPRLDAQERAFISRFFELPGPNATQQERDFWEQSPVADLLYPQGHPCAGQPLDSTSPAVLAQAGKEALAKSIDSIPDVDTPQCVYQGNWPFFPLNQACSSVVPEDPVSVAHCTDFLLNMQQDPSAYPATIWLPCSMGQQPTTRRAFYEGLITDEVQKVFSGPPCTVK